LSGLVGRFGRAGLGRAEAGCTEAQPAPEQCEGRRSAASLGRLIGEAREESPETVAAGIMLRPAPARRQGLRSMVLQLQVGKSGGERQPCRSSATSSAEVRPIGEARDEPTRNRHRRDHAAPGAGAAIG